jgi:periplasmic protein TonB
MTADTKKSRTLFTLGFIFLIVLVGLGVWQLKEKFGKQETSTKKIVQQITVLTPPPPPPPPPEPPKPEEKVEEEIPDETPPETPPDQPDNDQSPAGADLGVDADAGAGGDGFGLVGRKGGRDFMAGTGGGGSYTGAIKEKINALLTDDEQLKYMKYSAKLKIWIAPDGKVERFEVMQTDGDKNAKPLMEKAMMGLPRFASGPPSDMQLPIIWQITSSI